jgi:hypothetical protein
MTYLAKVFEQYDCENPWKSQTKCPRTSGYIGIWHMFLSSKAFWGLNHTSLIRAAQHSSVLSKKSCFFQRITAVKCAPVVANDKCKLNILLEHHEDQKRHLMTMWAWGRTSTCRICCSKHKVAIILIKFMQTQSKTCSSLCFPGCYHDCHATWRSPS